MDIRFCNKGCERMGSTDSLQMTSLRMSVSGDCKRPRTHGRREKIMCAAAHPRTKFLLGYAQRL